MKDPSDIDVSRESPDGLQATSLDEKDKGSTLAMCAVVKDQAKELDEWISYHQKLGATDRMLLQCEARSLGMLSIAVPAGFQTFYIIDDNSSPPLLEPLQKAIASGLVDYHHVATPADGNRQRLAYDSCLKNGRHHQWMAFFDVDEVPSTSPYFSCTSYQSGASLTSLRVHPSVLGHQRHRACPQSASLPGSIHRVCSLGCELEGELLSYAVAYMLTSCNPKEERGCTMQLYSH